MQHKAKKLINYYVFQAFLKKKTNDETWWLFILIYFRNAIKNNAWVILLHF